MSVILKADYLDMMDRNRKVSPIEQDGRDYLCRIFIREPKFMRMRVRREKEDGREGQTEIVIVSRSIDTPWQFVGKAKVPASLMFDRSEKAWDIINNVGFKLM